MSNRQNPRRNPSAIVIGAGIAGLCSAARLVAAGFDVTVLERASAPGGKIRSVPTVAGPSDAGPTVMTLRPVFEEVFAALGARLNDCLTIRRSPVLARHFWPDGSTLDLTSDSAANTAAIEAFSDAANARGYRRFHRQTQALFNSFRGPMMERARPVLPELVATVLRKPSLITAMAPWRSLQAHLNRLFPDPRLAQLFGRYATYVGGSPLRSPALLGLIWQAESAGVWHVEGGLAQLPKAIEQLCIQKGVTVLYNSEAEEILCQDGTVTGVALEGGRRLRADVVVFNGDPRALAEGALGPAAARVAPQTQTAPRSLSALVWSFAATVSGPALTHHNVIFSKDNADEFRQLQSGRVPTDPTIYICAQDRGGDSRPKRGAPERFEMIINAPPLDAATGPELDFETCQTRTFRTLARLGLHFDPLPGPEALTTPRDFAERYPESLGSLYGQSPHGLTASLSRPQARTPIQGLYLAGGGAHPGAGIPMAALSAKHAVEEILSARTSRLAFRPTATPGGMSTASATMAPGPSRS